MTRKWIPILALALVLAAPALAGGEGCRKAAAAARQTAQVDGCSGSAQSCLDGMVARLRERGWIGIELETNETGDRLTVRGVEPDSPAQQAGLRQGDVLLALNDVPLGEENKQLYARKKGIAVGETVTYTVERNGYDLSVDVTPAPIPEPVLTRWLGEHMLEHATVALASN